MAIKFSQTPPIGERVLVAYNMQRLPGTVQFCGPTDFADGDMVGVALDAPAGKCDGSVMGRRYFQCASNHGLFVRPQALAPRPSAGLDLDENQLGERSRSQSPVVLGSARSPEKAEDSQAFSNATIRRGDEMLAVETNAIRQMTPAMDIIGGPSPLTPTSSGQRPFQADSTDRGFFSVAENRHFRPLSPAGRRVLPSGVEWVDTRQSARSSPFPSESLSEAGLENTDDADFDIVSATAGLNPFWNAVGTASLDIKERAYQWCDANGVETIHDVCKYGLADEFTSALRLKPVQMLKAAEYFKARSSEHYSPVRDATQNVQAIENLDRKDAAAELHEILQQLLQNGTDRYGIAMELGDSNAEWRFKLPKAFAALYRCFADLKDVIAKVVLAKAWKLDQAEVPLKHDIMLLIAESEARLRADLRASESRLQQQIAAMRVYPPGAHSQGPGAAIASAGGTRGTDLTAVNASVQTKRLPQNGKSYMELFEEVGGKAALRRWKEVSEQLQLIVRDPELESQVWKLLPKDWQEKGYAAKPVQQHFVMGYDDLLAEAQRVSQTFMAKVMQLASATGGQAAVGQAVPADCAKLRARWSHGDAWHRLTDLLNVSVAYVDIASMYSGLEVAMKDFKGKVHKFSDNYLEPLSSGFCELLLVVEHSGHMCQLHLNTGAMLEAEQGPCTDELKHDIERAVSEGNLAGCLSLLAWSDKLGISADILSTANALHKALLVS